MRVTRLRDAFGAGAALLLCLVPLVWKAGVPDSTFHMEVMSLMPSQETWLRSHEGDVHAWIVPSWNGRPRLNKPPLLVWLNLLAWHGMDPERAAVDDLIRRARLLSAGLAGLGLASVYAMGRLLGGPSMAWRAALVTGTTFFFIRQGRLASYDTHLFAWVTASVALIWIALNKAGRSARPPAAAWAVALLAGAALGSAVLTKGPIAFLFVLVPAGAILWTLDPPRKPCVMLVLFASAAALALAFPWYAYLLRQFPGAGQVLLGEFRQARQHAQFPLYYLMLLALVFPWTFALAGALGALFSGPFRKTLARKEWIPSVWLLAVLLAMSLPEAKRERYIFPVLPAAGLIAAQGWGWLEERTRNGIAPAGWQRILLSAHFAVLLGCSAAIAVFPAAQGALLQWGLWKEPELPDLGWTTSLVAGFLLSSLTLWALLGARAGRYGRAFALSGVWMALASTLVLNFYVHSHHGRYAARSAAEKTARLSQEARLFWLCLDPKSDREPDQKFLLYSRRIIPRIRPDELRALVNSNAKVALITGTDESHGQVASGVGLEPVLTFHDSRNERALWLLEPPSFSGLSLQIP